MLHRAVPLILASLLFAAIGCDESTDAAPSIDRGPDVMTGERNTPPQTDAGSPDASRVAASEASGPGAGSDAMLGDSAIGETPMPDAGKADSGTDASAGPSVDQAKPPEPEPIPDCPPSPIAFDSPRPATATGLVQLDLSSWLQPVGFLERVSVRVLNQQYQPDTSYNGKLAWTVPDGVEVIDATPISAGVAELTLRFKHAGSFMLEVMLTNDPRSGRAELFAYDSQLPVWELAVDPAALAALYDGPGGDSAISGVLTIESVPHEMTARLHGGSSRYFKKKSFRFDLADTDPRPPAYGKKLILRAEYNDKTQLRNWLALRLLRASTMLPTPRSKLVHFRINGRFYGLMHNVERIGKPFLRAWGMSDMGSLYEADPPLALAIPGGNLSPLSPEAYPMVYQHQAGTIDYTDLRTLIEETLTLPDPEFARIAETEIMVDEYIQYLAALAAIQDHDQVRKNYYLYRDPSGSAGWRVLPWDFDLTFGHLWSEENDVLEEKIVTDSDIFVGAYDPARGGFYNQLTDRLLRVPQYRSRFRGLVEHMLDTTITRPQANMLLQAALRCATPEIVGDSQKRAGNGEYQARLTEILDYLDARLAFVRGLPK